MKLITDQETLAPHIPNMIVNVKGETALFDKIAVHLQAAEDWVIRTFTAQKSFTSIVGYTADNPIRTLTARLIVAEALRLALPSLDLVFTPNGFAVTQTTNLTPASKQRVDRLIGSLLALRDECISQLLPLLPGVSQWLNSDRADYFGGTLFPTLDIVEQVPGNTPKWERYLELRPQVIDLEASLAEEWFSPELMSALRSENLRSDLTQPRKVVADQVKAQVVGYLKGGSFNSRRLADIVNYIRQREEEFAEWHGSETAQLFAPPVFRNKKNAPGYFF
mgnify:CR=1 FL=1